MSHALDFSKNAPAIAYVGQRPWHGYGRVLTAGASQAEWLVASGLDYHLIERPVYFDDHGAMDRPIDAGVLPRRVEAFKAIVRDDTNAALSVVSSRYKLVQPAEVLGFFANLVEKAGYVLETAGALKGGRRYWALAKTGQVATILGQDEIRGYLLLSTSCDGSIATTAQYTSIRVVCNNTLSYAIEDAERGGSETGRLVTVRHNTAFSAQQVQEKLATSQESWDAFISRSTAMAQQRVTIDQAVVYFSKLMGAGDKLAKAEMKSLERYLSEWESGVGSGMDSARRTIWGLLNAVTHDVDHARRERAEGNRMDSAWFGAGASMKSRAETLANELLDEVA